MIGREVKYPWHPGYCILEPRQRMICCYKEEPYPIGRWEKHFSECLEHANGFAASVYQHERFTNAFSLISSVDPRKTEQLQQGADSYKIRYCQDQQYSYALF
ncbi:unnamed protein product [Caenorhabditis auriculariae]|uniref:Uncharacterized protein n=1 Tax=Caenorhabditis auriculariae TaxID=2777116 RepID=A0A8S1H068_9PELO|nr:unnamed protein product [Caenorhabditis auriculariae]